MGQGIFKQIQKGNTFEYKKLTLKTVKEVIWEVYDSERSNTIKELNKLTTINSSQLDVIKDLIYSDLDEDFILAKEIINNLKNK